MSKWILMPDSFKGTMSSLEICQLMREALLRHVPDAEVVSIPVADGGEGSVEAFLGRHGRPPGRGALPPVRIFVRSLVFTVCWPMATPP